KDQGYSNADVTLVGRIFDKDQFDKLQKCLKEIHPRRKGAARDPLTIVHPALDCLGINTVYVVAIESPKLGEDGIVEIRIKCIEYVKPKPTKKKKPTPISADQRAMLQRLANASVTTGEANAQLGTRGGEIKNEYGDLVKNDLGYIAPRHNALGFLDETPVFLGGG
ncbi:MAG TPA: hypothetical protein VK509_01960, partial [Polyangiales bacterium]|nr:hypothetical protein [Polyangiales bacterium]